MTDFPDLDPKLASMVTEAASHRWDVKIDDIGDSPSELYEGIVKLRGHQDRIEQIVVDLMRLRGRVSQAVSDRKALVDDGWDNEVVGATTFKISDPAPRERYAHYNLKVMSKTVELRKAQKALGDVETALEIVRMYHRGIDSTRREFEARIRALTYETRLER